MRDRTRGHGLSVAARLKSIFGGSIGNLVEWYDWYVYAAFSLYFASVFFPPANPTVQLLNSAAVFAGGFIVRPLGGWLMGIYADRHGRKHALSLSILFMCAGSMLIAVTPGYATIGWVSPALLIFARIIQGLSLGGEYGTSATYLSEMAEHRNRGFYSSFLYVTLSMGQLLALAVLVLLQQVLLTPEELQAWGWRIPFVVGGLLAVVAAYIRRGIEETPSFEIVQESGARGGLAVLLRTHPKELVLVVGLTMGGAVAFNAFTTYSQKFLVNTAGWTKDDASMTMTVALFLFMAIQPLFGWISDKVGRKPPLIFFGVTGTLFSVPIMTTLAHTRDHLVGFLLVMAALVSASGYTAISAAVKAEMFSVEVRALGVGLPYSLTVAIFGGTAEFVALYLKNIGHESWFFWYVSFTIAISLIFYVIMPETRHNSAITEVD